MTDLRPAPRVVHGAGFLLGTARDTGGLLIAEATGEAYALNASATFVWARFLTGAEPKTIADELQARFGIGPLRAQADVKATLDGPHALETSAASDGAAPSMPRRWDQPAPYWYERQGTGFRLGIDDRPLFELAGDGKRLRWVEPVEARSTPPSAEAPFTLEGHLWVLAPRLLALQGHTVLHTSAVTLHDDGGAILFLGDSGAGKSTTARAFVAAGARALADDKAVLADREGRLGLLPGVEHILRTWTREVAARLRKGAEDAPGPDLGSLAGTNPIAATRLYVVDRTQRDASRRGLQPQPIDEGAALGYLFQQGFLGTFDIQEWRERLLAVARLCADAECARLAVPDGLEALQAAVRAFVDDAATR